MVWRVGLPRSFFATLRERGTCASSPNSKATFRCIGIRWGWWLAVVIAGPVGWCCVSLVRSPASHSVERQSSNLGAVLGQQTCSVISDAGLLEPGKQTQPAPVGSLYPAFPFRYLVWDRWASINRIGRVKIPVTIFHGSADSMVPIANAKRLAEAGGTRVTFHEIEGAEHNHLPRSQLRKTFKAITARLQGFATGATGESTDQSVD